MAKPDIGPDATSEGILRWVCAGRYAGHLKGYDVLMKFRARLWHIYICPRG